MWGTKNDHFLKKEDDEGDHNDDNDDEDDDEDEDDDDDDEDDEDDEEEEDYDEDGGWKLKVAMHWEGRQWQDMTLHPIPIPLYVTRHVFFIL